MERIGIQANILNPARHVVLQILVRDLMGFFFFFFFFFNVWQKKNAFIHTWLGSVCLFGFWSGAVLKLLKYIMEDVFAAEHMP